MMHELIYNEHKVLVHTFDIRQQEHSWWSSGKFYEVENLKILERIKKEGSFVDIGARSGNYSLFMQKVTNRLCYAFEPDELLFSKMRKNINQNNAIEINLLNIALSDYCGYAYRPNGKTIYIKKRNDLMTTKVNILDLYNLSECAIIRINCSDHHLQILSGAKATIRKYKPDLFFNVYEKRTEKLSAISEFLNKTIGIRYDYQIHSTDTLHHYKAR